MKKSIIILLCCLILAIGLVAGCAMVTAKPLTLRLAHAQVTNDVYHLTSLKFKEYVEEKSEGQVKIDIYPAGQLGSIRDMIEGLRLGTIHIVHDTPSRLGVYDPLGDIFNLPYLIRDRAHGEAVWNGPVGEEIHVALAQKTGIRTLAMAWRGSREVTSKKPFSTPDELKALGLKIRVPPYDLSVNTWKELGANPTPMDWNEVYLALQQGVIDAQENPNSQNYSNKLWEVTDYLILTSHVKNFSGFMIGNRFLESLPEDTRNLLFEAARAAAAWQGDHVEAEDEQFLKGLAENGMVIIETDQQLFMDVFKDFVPKYYPHLADYVKRIAEVQ